MSRTVKLVTVLMVALSAGACGAPSGAGLLVLAGAYTVFYWRSLPNQGIPPG